MVKVDWKQIRKIINRYGNGVKRYLHKRPDGYYIGRGYTVNY